MIDDGAAESSEYKVVDSVGMREREKGKTSVHLLYEIFYTIGKFQLPYYTI